MNAKPKGVRFSLGTFFLVSLCLALLTGWLLERRSYELRIKELLERQTVLEKESDLRRPGMRVRQDAIKWIKEYAPDESVNALIYALTDPTESVRRDALDALRKILVDNDRLP